jgi:UDP-N-acetylglucosamine 2-epimerase (non-hydrolysing)
MKIVTVVGARPNFMKVAPLIAAIRKHNDKARQINAGLTSEAVVPTVDHILVHTGQHHDPVMSDSFFADLNLPAPDIHLGVSAASAVNQTAEILQKFEPVLMRERPDVVVVVGDVTSTVACAIVTAKVSFDSNGARPLLAHVEAGLRSFDRSMPEEINRIVTDHLCDIFFVTEESGLRNLQNEGRPLHAAHFVGNTMIDSLLAFQDKAEGSGILERLGLRTPSAGTGNAPYALLTLHRPANVDNRESFTTILAGLEKLAKDWPIVFPVHPRTQRRIKEFGLDVDLSTNASRAGIILIDPLGYLDFVCLMKHATLVITDSGGIQEETTCLGVPCVTVRNNTERPVTVDYGTNILAGTTQEGIEAAIAQQMHKRGPSNAPKNWDGQAARRIVEILTTQYAGTMSREMVAEQLCR